MDRKLIAPGPENRSYCLGRDPVRSGSLVCRVNKMELQRETVAITVALQLFSAVVLAQNLSCTLLSLRQARRRWKRKQLQLLTSNCNLRCKRTRKKKSSGRRRFWVKPGRSSQWGDNFVNDLVTEEDWKQNFRMSKECLYQLCHEVGPYIVKQDTKMRKALADDEQVAVTLYYLADEGRMQKVANAFGRAKNTVSGVVKRVTHAISSVMGPKYVRHPQTEEEVEEMTRFVFFLKN